MRLISQKLRDSARGRDCTLRLPFVCNYDPATTVLAHLPCGMKGVGMKGPDIIAVFACSSCHDALDRRSWMAEIGWRDITRAIALTQMHWVETGLLTIKGLK